MSTVILTLYTYYSNSIALTSTDPRYLAFTFDMLTNLSATHFDTRVCLNRGLTSSSDELGGLGVRGQNDSGLLESFDSNEVVKNLCASQSYHFMDMFLTFTCNQKKHFGVKCVKQWIDSTEWQAFYPGFDSLPSFEQQEVRDAIIQASAGLLLRNWQEVSTLFVDYLRKSPSSPYRRVNSIFVRYEYQKDAGNLSHIHLILEISWKLLSDEEKEFVKDLIRSSIVDVVRTEELQSYFDEGIFTSIDEYKDMVHDASKFLPHHCSPRCLMRTGPGPNDFRCRKLNNRLISNNNTKHTFKKLPNDYSSECINKLIKIGIASPICVNADGYEQPIQYNLPFFHPKRHVPPTNPSDDLNMSPVEGKTFSVCRSMQNAQLLTDCGGVNKYVCKYIGKIDEKNYVIVNVDGKGQLTTKSVFLHNTKVTTSKINEDKARENSRDNSHVQGRAISHMEMLHVMLKYPEVITDLNFVKVPTLPLELRAGIDCEKKASVSNAADAEHAGWLSNDIRNSKETIPFWRKHTANESLTFKGVSMSRVSIDKVSKFSLRPPELRIFDTMRGYFRWFEYGSTYLTGDQLDDMLDQEFERVRFVDGLMQQVKIRHKALPEILAYLENDLQHDNTEINYNDSIRVMKALFQDINRVLTTDKDELNIDELDFLGHIELHLIVFHSPGYHLPCPVFSYPKPTTGMQFILHILLSLGRFETEIDLTTHATIRDCFRYAKLIGDSDNPDDLENYSNELLLNYIKHQVIYFPNSKRVIDSWIIAAGDLFDSVIIRDEIPICNIPPVQLSTLFCDVEASNQSFSKDIKSNIIDAALKELGEDTIVQCNIPSKEELTNATKGFPLNWDAVSSFSKSDCQSDASFNEQKLAIEYCSAAIENYCQLTNIFTKCTGIRGFPGSGKTWTMQYCVVYALSKGLTVISSSQMARRSIQLGGKHIAYLFGLTIEKNISPHRRAELAISKLLRDPKKINFILGLDILFIDELGQLSSELIAILDIILRKIRNTNIFFGGVLIMFTIDHTQIQPFDARPFLTSIHVIPCFRMVALETSVRAGGDLTFFRIQQIARFPYWMFEENPGLIDEFIQLLSDNFTFVDDWTSELITPSTYRLYSKKIPAKEAAQQFIDRVRRQVDGHLLKARKSDDVEKSRFSHREWRPATQRVVDQLEQAVKEPNEILFFRGAKYEFTYNEEDKFSQSQLGLLFDMPCQNDLDRFRKIAVLAAPPGIKDIEFEADVSKDYYLSKGFKEVKVGVAPERTKALKQNTQAKRKQYGLRHRVTSTIHAAQGETLSSMATEVSLNDPLFRLWDKGQLVVILSRTKQAKNTIFVGNKPDTIDALKSILTKKTQWCDYIEHVLELVTVNSSSNNILQRHQIRNQRHLMNQEAFPFRICDIPLPQCRTGFVYFLISVKQKSYTYIGTTKCIRKRIQQHNNGYGAHGTAPLYLRPFAVMAYICGFDGEKTQLRFHMERQWKLKRNYLKSNGCDDPREWASIGQDVINDVANSDSFDVNSIDLRLVCHFRNVTNDDN
jgi:predicted GIY-YIG superfamily endonuclease